MTNALYQILWMSQPFLKLAIVYFMYRRKLHLRFPIFFSFVIFGIVENLVLYVVHFGSYATYFYTYWTISATRPPPAPAPLHHPSTALPRPHHAPPASRP